MEKTPPCPATGGELKQVMEAQRAGSPFLLYRDADGRQQVFVLQPGARPITVGRGLEADLPLTWDPEVSSIHSELQSVGTEWLIADDGLSRNGTYVNGKKLSGRHRLREGDVVRVGRTVVWFRGVADAPVRTKVADVDLPTVEQLTDTQRRILVALCRPYAQGETFEPPATNQQVADEVFLGVDAVKAHLRTLFQKFDLDGEPQNRKRAKLAECVMQSGLVTPRDF